MGNPFRPLTRRSPSPSRPVTVAVAVRRPSASSSSSHHHQQQHQHLHPTPAQRSTDPPSSQNHSPPVATPATSERANKRIKLTVRKPTIDSPATRHGHSAKKDDSSSSSPNPSAARPPTRLTFAKPDGDLIRTTNGVQTTLKFAHDVPATDSSRASTAEPSQRQTRKAADRRSLRSHDEGPRLKSELAVYFPYYEDVIYDAPKELELLDSDTIFVLKDDPQETPAKPKSKSKDKAKSKTEDKDTIQVAPRQLTSPRSKAPLLNVVSPASERNRFNGAQVVDFSTIEKSVGHHPRDPLTESYYFKSHRRAERKEKQLRNIEKERAMHEKAQLERLLDGLQGHDWLRMMGITGVTDSEAKKFEPKRNYFIAEVQALLDKFRTWKEEERRLKLEKEAAAAAEEEAEEEDDEEDDGTEVGSSVGPVVATEGEVSFSDFDGAAARQLQLEASSGGGKDKGGKAKQREKAATQPARPLLPVVYRPPTPEGPFVSFYAKPHLRAAALGKARHGRNLTAFGQPLPEPTEKEFSLPEEYVTPETIKESARRRRRMKRESLVEGKK